MQKKVEIIKTLIITNFLLNKLIKNNIIPNNPKLFQRFMEKILKELMVLILI